MKIATTDNTIVLVTDNPADGGANHHYIVTDANGLPLADISFQKGPIGEHGVNGVQHVDLLKIIQHRLDCFQSGDFKSPVNEVTCGFVSAAIASEGTRTRRRVAASVEGTSTKAKGVES